MPSSCGCRCNSFAPGTPVLLANGATKPIEDIKIGDEVLTTDPEADETTSKPVTALHHNLDTELTNITLSVPTEHVGAAAEQATEGVGGRSTRGPTQPVTLNTTAHHPFWDSEAEAWVNAGELVAGRSTLRTPDGQAVAVTAVANFSGARWMHDLTVADIHTFYVLAGATPVLVHNCDDAMLDAVDQLPVDKRTRTRAFSTPARTSFRYRAEGLGQPLRCRVRAPA